MELSAEDSLRINVLLANKPQAIRINESSMTVFGLSANGEAQIELNPTGRHEQYLKRVKELFSGHVLGSPGGYPVYLQRWTRMGQMRDDNLDQLLLLGEPEDRQTSEKIERFLMLLWDIGLEVGYATRSMKDCISLARQDYEVLTSLLDARFICGMSTLYIQMTEEIRRKILHRRDKDIIRWLIDTNQERHRQFGDRRFGGLPHPDRHAGRNQGVIGRVVWRRFGSQPVRLEAHCCEAPG